MKKLSVIIMLFALSACHKDSGGPKHFSYTQSPNAGIGAPANPDYPFDNKSAKHNAAITGIISNNNSIISDYVTYRLHNYSHYNGDISADISKTEIADAMQWLTTGEKTADEITTKYAGKDELLYLAVYAIDNRINNCISKNGTPAGCFVKWRGNNPETFKNISNEILKYTTPLSATDARMHTANDTQIKFIIDDSGAITGATIVKDGTETDYEHWMNLPTGELPVTAYTMNYDSAGKNMGLMYSDFGTYYISKHQFEEDTGKDITSIVESRVPFAGGYDSHKVDTADITADLSFSGRAVGRAQSDTNTVYLDDEATLKFEKETGHSTLNADFNNWYDIEVKDNGEIKFSNYTGYNDIVKLSAPENPDGTITATGANMDVEYYAPQPATRIPTEAAGLVQYTENASGIKMDISFGAKK